jgi:hypothetical protein
MIGIGITISLRSAGPAGPPPANSAPVNTVAPSISGTPQVGQTLTASRGTWTGYPSPTFTDQWKRDGVAISGATSLTYDQVTADLNAIMTFTPTASNGVGAPVPATSDGVGPVIAAGGGGSSSYLLQEDGTFFVLEDASGFILMEA